MKSISANGNLSCLLWIGAVAWACLCVSAVSAAQPTAKRAPAATTVPAVRVTRGERVLADLVAGNILGSALLLSGVPADVDAIAVEPVRAIRWEVGTLERYLIANPETRIIMQRHLARDLAGKMDLLIKGPPKTTEPDEKN